MVNIFHGQVLKQEFLKDQLLVIFFFLIVINDLSDNLVLNPKRLLMIPLSFWLSRILLYQQGM